MAVAAAALALALRMALGGCDAASAALEGRQEIGTPANSLRRAREGAFLLEMGISPYTGSSFHGPPLLLPLLGPFLLPTALRSPGHSPLASSFPFVAADALSALLIFTITKVLVR